MKAIWKFELTDAEKQYITAPAGAKFIRVGKQGHVTCIWAEVDKDRSEVEYLVTIVGTGWEFEDIGNYVGTFTVESSITLVFHIYVRRKNV